MRVLCGALALGMVVGCANEKKDVQKICKIVDESVTQNLGDKDIDAKLKDAGVKSEAGKSIRDGLTATNVDGKLTALKKLSDKAKEHKLETECTAAIQVAELAEAFMAALKDAASDPKKAKEVAKKAKKAKKMLGEAAAKEEEKKAGVKEEEEEKGAATTGTKVEAGGSTVTTTTTGTGTTVTGDTGTGTSGTVTTTGGSTTVTGTTGGTTGTVTTKPDLGGITKALGAVKRKGKKK